MEYAIVESGGKQYKAVTGGTIEVDRLPQEAGDQVVLERVLLYSDGSTVNVGTPTLEGAQVKATVVAQVKAPKVLVFKYRPKLRYRVKRGHRQHYTRLKVDSIELAKARKPRAKKSESQAEEVAEESPKE
ncbi:MAG TPA: 50S ribosomal protein L21 [Anaerolineales bacterium]|nr:50S ribosomal protein L21 [Anaerolineales bacterium]